MAFKILVKNLSEKAVAENKFIWLHSACFDFNEIALLLGTAPFQNKIGQYSHELTALFVKVCHNK